MFIRAFTGLYRPLFHRPPPSVTTVHKTGIYCMALKQGRGVATLAVQEDGSVLLDPSLEAPLLEEAPAARSDVRTLYLNRPKALHALSETMLRRLHARLRHLNDDPAVHCIVLRSTGPAGRAFCAGGDIRDMHRHSSTLAFAEVDRYFRTEYTLNYLISQLDTPLLSLWDGICMGGGVGISIHGRFRVATENTVFAMPECAIGIHPDIGASFFLPRLRGPAFAAYLALTGARVRGRQALDLGVATHFLNAHHIDDLVRRLEAVDVKTYTAIDKVLCEFEQAPPKKASYPSPTALNVVERCFNADTVEDIVSSVQDVTRGDNRQDVSFAKETLELIGKGSPVSLKVALESMRRGQRMSLAECLDSEFRLSVRCSRSNNIIEGVRAAVIDRSKPPMWTPKSLEEVSREDVDAYFKPLDDIGVPDLGLSVRMKNESVEVDSSAAKL